MTLVLVEADADRPSPNDHRYVEVPPSGSLHGVALNVHVALSQLVVKAATGVGVGFVEAGNRNRPRLAQSIDWSTTFEDPLGSPCFQRIFSSAPEESSTKYIQ